MQIREANPDDFDAIVAMCASSMAEAYGAFLTAEQMAPWIAGEALSEYLRDVYDGALVAELDGAVRGVTVVGDDLIDLVWVDAGFRGRGIARALVEAAEAAVTAAGRDTARIEVFGPNAAARACYERLGYRRVDRYPCPMTGVDKIVYARRLSR